MNQTQVALSDIKLIKDTLNNTRNDITSIYSVFLILGIGKLIYYIIYYFIFYLSPTDHYLSMGLMILTFLNWTCYILAFIRYVLLLRIQYNVFAIKSYIFLGTCIFLIPFFIFLINILIPINIEASIASDIRSLLTNHYTTISILIYCGMLLFMGFEKDFKKFLCVSIIFIITYILVIILISKKVINSDLILFSIRDRNLSIELEEFFSVIIATVGNIFLGLYLKTRKKH